MTQAEHSHEEQPGLPFPGFRPSGDYGVLAQNRQLARTREERDAYEDRAVFYEACLAQLQAEKDEQVGNLAATLSQTRSELAQAQRDIEQLKNPPLVVEGEPTAAGAPATNGAVTPLGIPIPPTE